MKCVSSLGCRCAICVLFTITFAYKSPGEVRRNFTVADDIAFSYFGDPYAHTSEAITFSPNRVYFSVQTARGLVRSNRFESTVTIFRLQDVMTFVNNPHLIGQPSPVWTIRKATCKDGPVITALKWSRDSTMITYLVRRSDNNNQLFWGSLRTKLSHALTPTTQDVTGYDFRDPTHFVYTVRSPLIYDAARNRTEPIIGTGRSLQSLIFPVEKYPFYKDAYDLSELWAAVGSAPFRVIDRTSGTPFMLHLEGTQALSLSPQGQSVVTVLAPTSIPQSWESMYPPPVASSPFRIRAGQQGPAALEGVREITEYVLINLHKRTSTTLTNAPTGDRAGWYGAVVADWSNDGRFIALSNTFIRRARENADKFQNRPCTAVKDLLTDSLNCVEYLKGQTVTGFENGWHYVTHVQFVAGSNKSLVIQYRALDGSSGSTLYIRDKASTWIVGSNKTPPSQNNLEIKVDESLNDPPVLAATDPKTRVSRVIMDPNPGLNTVNLGAVSPFNWKDESGRDWTGGLYKPFGYSPGQRYPLVIQTHGFKPKQFIPSGIYPTAFAARELAAAGILVLQTPDCPIQESPQEGSCNVSGYEAAIQKLIATGIVDPKRVGIVGFSRSCYYVMEALTSSTVHFRAASITDGVNEGYLQYLVTVDTGFNLIGHDAEALNGAMPFGVGLKEWIERCPGFNMDKVTAPLQIVATDPYVVLAMWEPYAALRYLDQPVDLVVLGPGTHLLTNPAQRMASQGGTLDWFRFWLLDQEDPDPAKTEQYRRWRGLRALEEEHERR